MLSTFFTFVRDKLIYLITFSILIGLLYGYFFPSQIFQPLIFPVLFLMIYPMMINLDLLALGDAFKNFKPIALSLLINYTISPILAIILAKLFFASNPHFIVALYLIALLPTSGMTIAWTGLAKGNIMTALIMVSFNLLLSIPLLPIYMKFMLGTSVNVDAVQIIQELVKFVVIPMILGDLTRRFILKKWGKEVFNKKIKPQLSGFSSTGVVVLVFMAIAMRSQKIIEQLDQAIIAIVVMFVYYFLILFISHLIGNKLLEYGDRVALVYATAARDLTIALAIAIVLFPDSVLLIAVSYIAQVPIAAFYLKYNQKKYII